MNKTPQDVGPAGSKEAKEEPDTQHWPNAAQCWSVLLDPTVQMP
jgi:hypothetical protein